MNPSLFELIKSLSKAEKRFFMLESARYSSKSNKGYLEVYKLLDKQSVYDEKQLKKKFADTPSAKRLPQLKNYLYNLILKILIKFNAQKSIDFEIIELLQGIDILFTKGLYKQAKKLLTKAKKLAKHYNKTTHLIRIYEWEQSFALMEHPLKKMIETGKKVLAEKRELITDMTNIYEYETIYYNINEQLFSAGRKSKVLSPLVYKMHQHPILQTDEMLSSWQAKNLFYFIHSTFYFFDQQYEKSLHYCNLRVDLFEKNEGFLKENYKRYLDAAYNNIQAYISNNKFNDALKQIERVETLTNSIKVPISEQSKHLAFTIIYTHRIRLYLEEHDYKSVIHLGEQLKKIDKYLVATKEQDKNYFIVLRQIASAHFILNENKKAIYWLDLILNNDLWSGIRTDLLGYIRLFYIILQYETRNYRILDYYINNTERYLTKHNILFKYEQILIRFFRKFTQNINISEKQLEALTQVKSQIEKMKSKKAKDNRELEQKYIEAWIESKIQRTSIHKTLTMAE